jgi:hypothetical protein
LEEAMTPCVSATREQIRAVRVARANALKSALDADAHPLVLSGGATVLLFLIANDLEHVECAGHLDQSASCWRKP